MTKEKNDHFSAAKENHLKWLVKSRSMNQQSTLDLRNVLYKYGELIQESRSFAPISATLLEVNFSLWRAVFLSELEEGVGNIIRDAKKFADELIENNTITYTQDKGTKEFTFLYYMDNAKYRLIDINTRSKTILPDADYPEVGGLSDKDWWMREQTAAIAAITNLEKALSEKNSK